MRPSAEIETRVREEIVKAENILSNLDADRLFDSPYVASAVYYREGFLSRYPTEKEDGDPARRIISHVVRVMNPELKAKYLALLSDRYGEQLSQIPNRHYFLPVHWEPPVKKRRRRRQNHLYAMDLFIREGSAVHSTSRGVVILAESGWSMEDPFSTSSRMGGNTIVVIDPEAKRMFRYCHLDSVLVSAGEIVQGGQKIGTVGHSGINASRPKHGGHLHFEVNEFDDRGVRALDQKQLIILLTRAVASEPALAVNGAR